MKKIIKSQDATFGPYATIETLSDRYRCDGVDIPFLVVDPCTIEDVSDDWVDPAAIAAEEAFKKAAYNDSQKAKRAEAYPKESDPLFFKAQRGEATLEEWRAKVAEIKRRYPETV